MSLITGSAGLVAKYWWVVLVRGVLLVTLGVMAFAWPGPTALAIAVLFGAFLLVDGVMEIAEGIAERRTSSSWGWLVAQGVLAVIAGLLALIWPGITALVLLYLVAFWAIVAGIAGIAAGLRLRRANSSHWGWFLAAGILGVLFGIVLVIRPGEGIVSLLWLVAVWAIIAGITMIIGSFWVRNAGRALSTSSSEPATST